MKPPQSTFAAILRKIPDRWPFKDKIFEQLIKATSCTADRAAQIAWEVHTMNESLCFTGSRERAELVANILEQIKLGVRLEPA